MKDVLLKIAESCYDEETTIDDEGNIEGGRLTFNEDKFITEITDMVNNFIHYLLTETNYPLLFAEISKEKTNEHFIYWNENLREFIKWRDKNCRVTSSGNYQQKYKHKSKTPKELFNYWYNEIREN